jgi:hypothetical protein
MADRIARSERIREAREAQIARRAEVRAAREAATAGNQTPAKAA